MAGMPGIVIKIGVNAADGIKNLDRVGKALQRTSTHADKARIAWKAAATGIAAGAAAFAAVAVDSANAFMEDQKSAAQLTQTLSNLGFGAATDEVNAFVDRLQYSSNIADDVLRPALSRLLRSTGDVAQAQDMMQLALDISAGTGKDLDTVANGLGKALDGNTASLGRLGLGLDSTVIKSGNMALIIQQLQDKFGGADNARSNTLSSSIDGVKIAFDELQESFGKGLIMGSGSDDPAQSLRDTEQALRDQQRSAEALGQTTHDVATDFGNLLSVGQSVGDLWSRGQKWDAIKLIFQTNGEAARQTSAQVRGLGDQFSYVQYQAYNAATAVDDFTSKLMAAGEAYTAANYFGGTPTSGYSPAYLAATRAESVANMNARIKARAAARAKKKSDRINAVRNTAAQADAALRAAARTGARRTVITASASQRSC